MPSQYNISSDISALLVEFYVDRALKESQYDNGLLKRGVKGEIPKGNSATIHWHRWAKFGLASTLTEGSQGDPTTGESMSVSEIKTTLVEFGDFVRIPLFGDSLRLDKAADQSYIKFNEQTQRSANRRIMTSLVQGDNGVTGNSYSAFAKRYAGTASGGSFAGLTTQQITAKDVQAAVAYLRQNQAPGPYYMTMDPWTQADLMIDDADFRELVKYTNLDVFKNQTIPKWAGANLELQDEPWRENVATLGGAEGTYSAAGGVVTCFIYSPEAYGTAQLMGKTGLKPSFHVQNISVTGSEMTIGYRIPFAAAVLNNTWGVQLRGVTRDASVVSVS